MASDGLSDVTSDGLSDVTSDGLSDVTSDGAHDGALTAVRMPRDATDASDVTSDGWSGCLASPCLAQT